MSTHHIGGSVFVGAGIFTGEVCCDRRDVVSCLLDCRASLQPSDSSQDAGATFRKVRTFAAHGGPNLNVFRKQWKMKILREDSDDCVRFAVKDYLAVECVFLCAKRALPKIVTDDGNTIASLFLLCLVKVSTACGRDFQEWEEVGGDAHPRQSFYLIIGCQVEGVGFVAGDVFETLTTCAPVLKVQVRDVAFGSFVRCRSPYRDDAIRILILRWTQNESVDNAEDCSGRADA